MTEVTGISPGDVLANSSFEKLQDNVKVEVPGNKPAPRNVAGSNAP
jgi:multidrug efflux system membrane fusion protein